MGRGGAGLRASRPAAQEAGNPGPQPETQPSSRLLSPCPASLFAALRGRCWFAAILTAPPRSVPHGLQTLSPRTPQGGEDGPPWLTARDTEALGRVGWAGTGSHHIPAAAHRGLLPSHRTAENERLWLLAGVGVVTAATEQNWVWTHGGDPGAILPSRAPKPDWVGEARGAP